MRTHWKCLSHDRRRLKNRQHVVCTYTKYRSPMNVPSTIKRGLTTALSTVEKGGVSLLEASVLFTSGYVPTQAGAQTPRAPFNTRPDTNNFLHSKIGKYLEFDFELRFLNSQLLDLIKHTRLPRSSFFFDTWERTAGIKKSWTVKRYLQSSDSFLD